MSTSLPAAPPRWPDRTAQLETLNEIARTATLELGLRPMLQRITDAMRRGFGWELVACAMLDHARGVCVYEALSTGAQAGVRVGFSHPVAEGVMGEVARTGTARLLDDVAALAVSRPAMPGTRSKLCVPVRHGGEVVALLKLESSAPAAFRGQLPLLETVAEQVAGAIASARLHRELTHRAALLEMVREVSHAALDAGELRLLLDRVVAYIRERFDLAVVSIFLTTEDGGHFRETAHSGCTRDEAVRQDQWPAGSGIVGRALGTGLAQLVPDVTADPDYLRVHASVASEFVVPIRFRDRMLGVLNLESETPEVFSPEHQVAFRTFADSLAGAIHLATLNRELETANESLRRANARLERLSWQDALTEVANRRRFDEVLASEWRRAGRGSIPLALVMVDIDAFKAFNDAFGHRRGDECLREVARTLRLSLKREGDFVARYGGEEFVLLLPATDTERGAAFAETLRARVEALGLEHPASPHGVLTASLGIASSVPARGQSSAELVDRADSALYAAKRAGGNRVLQG